MLKPPGMIKLLIISIAIFLPSASYSQTRSIKDSIIFLEPVVVINKSVKKTIVSFKTDGNPAYNGLQRMEKMVCLLKDLPEGKIKSATFHFNCGLINLLHKKLNINYKDVKLGIIIYHVSERGLPGKVISENEIEFVVSAEHRGSLDINLEKLNLKSQNIYIGFSILSETSNDENNIYIRFNESDNARCFVIYKNQNENFKNKWMQFVNYSFKTEIQIEKIN